MKLNLNSFQPIVLAAVFARSSAAAATAANANEPQVLPPTAAIIESELAIAQTQSQLGSGTRTSDVRKAVGRGVLRKSDGGSSSPGEMLDKTGIQRRIRADLSGSGDSGSKSGKSKSGKAVSSVAIAKPFPADGDALKAAVRDYVTQECAPRNGTCFVAQQWGFPMNEWDVSQVTDMSGLFYDSQGLFEDFNEDITGWDTGSVTDMSFMFFEAREFNQNLADWNVAKVEDMDLMFKDAQSFNQDISNWKFDDIESMTSMLDGAKSFDQNLCAWGEQPTVQLAVTIGNAQDIFRDSGCKLQVTPQDEDGPFCASCDDDGNETNTTSAQYLLCRQVPGREGIGLPDYDPEYDLGMPVFSAITKVELTKAKDTSLKDVTAVLDLMANGAALVPDVQVQAASKGIALTSGLLKTISHFSSKGETDPTQLLIQKVFGELSSGIKQLADLVAAGFDVIQEGLANIQLDELMSSLQAMNFAYQDMQVVTLTNATAEIKKLYADRYRNACNHAHNTPEDIFRNLYGYACGDNKNRACGTGKAVDTGTCMFGVKKRHYILDIAVDTAAGLPRKVLEVKRWLLATMVLAQFHSAVCLPADATTCNDPFTDPLQKEFARNQMLAMEEVQSNFAREVNCLENVSFDEYLKKDDFYLNVAPNKDCFKSVTTQGGVRGQEVNLCMVQSTQNALNEAFPSKEWTVVVFSPGPEGEVKLDINVKQVCFPSPTLEFGCIYTKEVKFDGETGRYFHLLYRKVGMAPKDYWFTEGISMGNEPPRTTYWTLPSLYRDYGVRRGKLDTLIFHPQYDDNCWIHPFVLPNDRKNLLSSEHGYIAFLGARGIDRAFAPGNFTILSDTIQWGNEKSFKDGGALKEMVSDSCTNKWSRAPQHMEQRFYDLIY